MDRSLNVWETRRIARRAESESAGRRATYALAPVSPIVCAYSHWLDAQALRLTSKSFAAAVSSRMLAANLDRVVVSRLERTKWGVLLPHLIGNGCWLTDSFLLECLTGDFERGIDPIRFCCALPLDRFPHLECRALTPFWWWGNLERGHVTYVELVPPNGDPDSEARMRYDLSLTSIGPDQAPVPNYIRRHALTDLERIGWCGASGFFVQDVECLWSRETLVQHEQAALTLSSSFPDKDESLADLVISALHRYSHRGYRFRFDRALQAEVDEAKRQCAAEQDDMALALFWLNGQQQQHASTTDCRDRRIDSMSDVELDDCFSLVPRRRRLQKRNRAPGRAHERRRPPKGNRDRGIY